eukprot:6193887-Pleurochrysis_carterae.AAC.4
MMLVLPALPLSQMCAVLIVYCTPIPPYCARHSHAHSSACRIAHHDIRVHLFTAETTSVQMSV